MKSRINFLSILVFSAIYSGDVLAENCRKKTGEPNGNHCFVTGDLGGKFVSGHNNGYDKTGVNNNSLIMNGLLSNNNFTLYGGETPAVHGNVIIENNNVIISDSKLGNLDSSGAYIYAGSGVKAKNNQVSLKNVVVNGTSDISGTLVTGTSNTEVSDSSVIVSNSHFMNDTSIYGAQGGENKRDSAVLRENTINIDKSKFESYTILVGGMAGNISNATLDGNNVNVNDSFFENHTRIYGAMNLSSNGSNQNNSVNVKNSIFKDLVDITILFSSETSTYTTVFLYLKDVIFNSETNILGIKTSHSQDISGVNVTLDGHIEFNVPERSTILAGKNFGDRDRLTGNIFNFRADPLRLKSVSGFENYKFFLNENIKDGDVLLKTIDAIDVNNSTVTVDGIHKNSELVKGGKATLMSNVSGNAKLINSETTLGTANLLSFELEKQKTKDSNETIIVNVILSEPKPEPLPEPKPEPQPEPKPEPQPEPKPEPLPEPKPEPLPEPKPEPLPEPKPEPLPEPKPEPLPEPKPEPLPEPEPEPLPEPEPEPLPEPKPEPQPEPEPEPQPEPKPEPLPEPKPEPQPEPEPEPEPEPQPEPKPEPQPEPEPEPQPEPEPEPQPKPEPEPQPKLNPQTQAYLSGRNAGMLSVNSGLVSKINLKGEHIEPIALVETGKNRFDIGKKLDLRASHFLVGNAVYSEKIDGSIGVFFEAGNSSYTSYNESRLPTVKGKGNVNYQGAGVILQKKLTNENIKFTTSLRGGKLNYDFKSNDFGVNKNITSQYNSDSVYWGAHIGIDKKIIIDTKNSITIRGIYQYTHMNKDNVKTKSPLGEEVIKFSSVNSHQTKLDATLKSRINDGVTLNSGLGYQHEFDGRTKGTIEGISMKEMSSKGSSGFASIGIEFGEKSNLSGEMKLTGYVGDKQGVEGLLNIKYRF
ncbi:autotransporter domain-containing protein [Xenorhabdus khoisanae]|uniref:autotransporter domain-containing protein n=1 Tax=Xenorhabdus khoisanae TaxID=880157 RepID=UPI00235811B7|nr:autotransporter domain-containing protein [Xenorhabdus khoisanae]MDC9612907.1 autotransporter domain-containing protein [Xenorhabdus khoisanae]